MVTINTNELVDRLNALHLPGTRWKVEADRDWSGDDAIWIWAVVEDNRLKAMSGRDLSELSSQMARAAAETQIPEEVIVYTRFVAESEA